MAATVSDRVRLFYEDLPFNHYATTEVARDQLRDHNAIEAAYPDLDALLRSGQVRNVLEIGCGCGWFANTVAYHYELPITAVDFTAKALRRAGEIADAMGVADRIRFVESNLFEFYSEERFDLLASIGVLHHTDDARRAFEHVARFVAPGKFVYLGLYHLYGRRVFLDMFAKIVREQGDAAALEKYRELDGVRAGDDVHLESWFRDQVLHPHETQHTLEEVVGWLDTSGFELRSTSVNRFGTITSRSELYEMEKGLEEVSRRANCEQGRYFPGFFTVMAQRTR